MLLQPRSHVRLFVRAVVVHHQVQLDILGKLPVQAAQKLQPFLMAMPTVTFTDHLAVQHVQRRKERGSAIAFVVVRHRTAPAALAGSDPTLESGSFHPNTAPASCRAGSNTTPLHRSTSPRISH